jgi:biopolymer transport protein TolR
MAMISGGGAGTKAEINVTPLVDVLLVLLIIFMVITPLAPRGLEALVPQAPKKPQAVEQDSTVVLEVLKRTGRPALRINAEDVSWDSLEARLQTIYKTRAQKVLFIKGDGGVEFSDVARVIDIAHAADPAVKVGLATKLDLGKS